jgi:hypothetical protein
MAICILFRSGRRSKFAFAGVLYLKFDSFVHISIPFFFAIYGYDSLYLFAQFNRNSGELQGKDKLSKMTKFSKLVI